MPHCMHTVVPQCVMPHFGIICHHLNEDWTTPCSKSSPYRIMFISVWSRWIFMYSNKLKQRVVEPLNYSQHVDTPNPRHRTKSIKISRYYSTKSLAGLISVWQPQIIRCLPYENSKSGLRCCSFEIISPSSRPQQSIIHIVHLECQTIIWSKLFVWPWYYIIRDSGLGLGYTHNIVFNAF